MKIAKVKILGTEYKVVLISPGKGEVEPDEDKIMESSNGLTNFVSKKIIIREELDECVRDNTLRHELIHAFLYESGLSDNWEDKEIGVEETTIDWIAMQFPKIQKAFNDVMIQI